MLSKFKMLSWKNNKKLMVIRLAMTSLELEQSVEKIGECVSLVDSWINQVEEGSVCSTDLFPAVMGETT